MVKARKAASDAIDKITEVLNLKSAAHASGLNVVYACGSRLHGRGLFIPFARSDSATSFAAVSLGELLTGMA